MPPSGERHRYYFQLFALDTKLDLDDANRDRLRKAIEGHILAEAELMGTYKRGQGEELPTNPLEKKAEQDQQATRTAPLAGETSTEAARQRSR